MRNRYLRICPHTPDAPLLATTLGDGRTYCMVRKVLYDSRCIPRERLHGLYITNMVRGTGFVIIEISHADC